MPIPAENTGAADTPSAIEDADRAAARKQRQALHAALRANGFADVDKAERWLESRELEGWDSSALIAALHYAPSPDTALPALVRLLEKDPALGQQLRIALEAGSSRDPKGSTAPSLRACENFLRLLGSSQALGDFLYRRSEYIRPLLHLAEPDTLNAEEDRLRAVQFPESLLPDSERAPRDEQFLTPIAPLDTEYRTQLLEAVGADPHAHTPTATWAENQRIGDAKPLYIQLRVAYRYALTRLALIDMCSIDPVALQPTIGRHLADLAAAAIEAALAIARAQVQTREPLASEVRLAVIGMGKCGARELNYISDVDVMYCAAAATPEDGSAPLDETRLISLATDMVHALTKAIMAPAPEPPLWEVDANLRPEGKDGALVRTLDAYMRYYQRWAENWEFQALLKARPMAGDAALGAEFARAIDPLVWESAARDSFVESVQAMRARVSDNIPADQREWQIKLGAGGLRDVEFTVQLLQLVHGRTDPSVRTKTTVDSIAALAESSYIGRADAAAFARDYQKLRVLEHRVQLAQLRRTHLMPQASEAQRVLARAVLPPDRLGELTSSSLLKAWRATKRDVRALHERLFFRPLLAAVAHLSADEVVLSEQAARDRLAALGYRDPRGAMRHIQALTAGLSRSAEIQRHLMPVLLGWLAQGVDADAGLLGFRIVSEALGSSSWYLRMLRDSPAAAEYLCALLSSSRRLTDLLEDTPTAIAWLDKAGELSPRTVKTLEREISSLLTRHADALEAMRAVRFLRRRELLRIGMAWALGFSDIESVCAGLAAVDECVIAAALAIAQREVLESEGVLSAEISVIAMGRLGGAENGFGSDADVMFVYRPAPGVEDSVASAQALSIVQRLMQLIKQPLKPPIRAERVLEIDADLRPEGKQGPLVRSLDSYAAYYEKWAEVWEFQALLRARPIAGDASLGRDFVALIDPYRYPADFSTVQAQEVRRIKARVENERMPHGADRTRQVKLGRGGLSDVEWLVQLLQLQHAHKVPGLRTTSTLQALAAAVEADVVSAEDAQSLRAAWLLATMVRGGNVMRGVRQSDVLQTNPVDMEAVARWCGYAPGSWRALEEDYLRTTRHARKVYERLFFA